MTALATAGFAVNTLVWLVISAIEPYLERRYGFGSGTRTAVVAAPLLVGALCCIPVGALTDRYGARVMFPLVSLVSAGAAAALAVAHTLAAVVVACCALGVGGAAFTVGAGMLVRADRPSRRGLRLSVFSAGIGGAAVGAALVGPLMDAFEVRTALLLIAAAPAAYAIVAGVLIRDPVDLRSHRSIARETAAVLRVGTMRYWVGLYSIAVGGLLAIALYLPAYLHRQYHRGWPGALLETAVFLAAAALARPLGGWLADRHDAVQVLTACFAGIAVLATVSAFEPAPAAARVTFLGVAILLGMAGGALCDLVGSTVPGDQAGLVTGVLGAAGALAGLVPPLILGAVDRLTDSFGVGFMLLADVALVAALHLRSRREWIGDALAYPAVYPLPANLDRTATTVVALSAADAAAAPTATLSALAELAVRHELVIAYGVDGSTAGTPTAHALIEAVRVRLPRFKITAVLIDAYPRRAGRTECAMLEQLIAEGNLAMAVIPASDPGPTAGTLATRLGADIALRLGHDPVDGVRLRSLTEPVSQVAG